MVITIRKKSNRNPKFHIYYIKYNNNIRKGRYTQFSDEIFKNRNYYDIVIFDWDKISFYLNIEDPQYLDEL